jgi:hypothetical protein
VGWDKMAQRLPDAKSSKGQLPLGFASRPRASGESASG